MHVMKKQSQTPTEVQLVQKILYTIIVKLGLLV